MITAGVDIGAMNTKAVILTDGQVSSYSLVPTGIDMKQSAELALEEALGRAGLSLSDVKGIIATGVGRKHVDFAHDQVSDITANARGMHWVFPRVRTTIDVGAEQSQATRVSDTGNVVDFVRNEKCAAGVGAFVESMAAALEVTVEDMEGLALASKNMTAMNATCVVFAESEAVSLIHSGVAKTDIARAILEAVVTRTVSMVRRLGVENDVALIGGVAQNAAVVKLTRDHLGVDILVPENPCIVGALGAALIARG